MVTNNLFRARHDSHTCGRAILHWKIEQLEKMLADHAGLRIVAWPKLDASVSPTECRAYGDVTVVDGEIVTGQVENNGADCASPGAEVEGDASDA